MAGWNGRVALVTGASTGIGARICMDLFKKGMTVIGCAKKFNNPIGLSSLQEVSSLQPVYRGRLFGLRCDLTRETEIHQLFEDIRKKYNRLDVCINNAGFSTNSPLLSAPATEWRDIMELNVIALSICSREAVQLMQDKKVTDGHIIQIGCITGHRLPNETVPGLNMFYASKSAVRTLTEGLRREIRQSYLPTIRVSSITPGAVETKFAEKCLGQKVASALYNRVTCLKPEDIANAVVHILESPPRVEINDIILQPVAYTI